MPSAIVIMMPTVGAMYVLVIYVEMGDLSYLSRRSMRRMYIFALRGS